MLIGLFDSGVGGLTVLNACKRAVPNASFLYYADCANAPYGGKAREEISRLSFSATSVLERAGCKIIVVACNTATTACIGELRKKIGVPVLGLEPAVKPALANTQGKVLLLATPFTAQHKKYPDRVIVGEEESLASEIEQSGLNPEILRALAKKTLAKYSGYEAVVTGCSHYAHLLPYFGCNAFDGAEGLAKRLKSLAENYSDE